MSAPDGSAVIVFNGEIYNHRELRRDLEGKGRLFRSGTDTEVLLHLYKTEGPDLVRRLRGMFALALWDVRARMLWLARDPHGIKPLYYSDDGRTFRFASSVRALLSGGHISRCVDFKGVAGFLCWGSVPEPWTLFRDVRSLPAGSTLLVTGQGASPPHSYWSVPTAYPLPLPTVTPSEAAAMVRSSVSESTRLHLEADVPVGAFLSGGVDSGALIGLAAELRGGDVRTVTLAFEEFRDTPRDEAPIAEATARLYGTSHTTVTLSSSAIQPALDAFWATMDQPTVDGLNVYLISLAVRQAGLKAALSGIGGDELFGGYPSFRWYPLLRRLADMPAASFMAAQLARLCGRIGPRPKRAKLRSLGHSLANPNSTYQLVRGLFQPHELNTLLRPEITHCLASDFFIPPEATRFATLARAPWAEVAVFEQCTYLRNQLLRDADWASMAHGLELRVPLVDSRLTEQIGAALATSRVGKVALARAPRPQLVGPLQRRKTGFNLPLTRLISSRGDGQALDLPDWLLSRSSRPRVAQMQSDVVAGRLHWSRFWALRVLLKYAEQTSLTA
jgi:asparagine synthase (glutamine-hydrolysing)